MIDKELISIVDAKVKKLWNEINTGHEYSIIEFYNQFYGICMEIAEMVQEEPASNPINFENELYKAFGQIKDFTLGMRIAKWFYDMGKNSQEPVSDDFTKALAECIHKAQCSVVDPLVHAEVWKEELVKLVKCEEPVSENLEKASKEWLAPQLDNSYAGYGETKMMELTRFDGYAMLDAIEFGAKWQKAKDEYITEDLGEYIRELSKQFPEVSFAKLSRIAVRVAKWQKEQMMANATEVTVHIDAGGYPYTPEIELYDYDKDIPLAKEGDKYKVVLIKEK